MAEKKPAAPAAPPATPEALPTPIPAPTSTPLSVTVAAVLPEGGNNTDDVLLYVNGVLETNISVTVGTINTGDTVDVRIGADEASHHFTGQMDDVVHNALFWLAGPAKVYFPAVLRHYP